MKRGVPKRTPRRTFKSVTCLEGILSGWIQLHRSLKNWEWFTDVNTSHLFIYCLLRANHKDTKWRGIDINRGQFLTSLDTLSRETGLTIRQVRTALDKLKLTGELTSKTTNKNRLISITNYNNYQEDDKQSVRKKAGKRQADDKQTTTDNNNNNENNENNIKNTDIFNFDIERLLDDKSRQAAKKKAPGWDLYYLMPIFNDWIKGKSIPDNPAGAFINWCGTYTKGKQL